MDIIIDVEDRNVVTSIFNFVLFQEGPKTYFKNENGSSPFEEFDRSSDQERRFEAL